MFHEQYEVLLVFSKLSEFNTDLINIIDSERSSCLKFTYLVDPTRKELELLLQQNKYLCIIPCTQYTLKKKCGHKYKLNNYIISQLLQNLELEFWGCTYISSLILHEKAICSQMSLGIPKPQVISRFHNKSVCNILKNKEMKAPIVLEPIYANNCLSKEKYTAASINEADSMISQLFDNDSDIEEFCVYGSIGSAEKIVITILGNPPLALSFVCESDTDFSEVNAVRNQDKYTRLLSNSYQLFREYNFRDFGQFIYSYDKENEIYYLVAVNYENCLDYTVITAFQQLYAVNRITDILNIILIVYLSRLEPTDTVVEFIKKFSVHLSEKVTESIIPFTVQQKINSAYCYKKICNELKGRFLSADEGNRNEFIKYINGCMKKLPDIHNPNEVYLGNADREYSFLQNYEALPDCPQNAQKVLDISMQILNGQMRWHAPSMLYNVNPPVMFNTVAATTVAKLYNPNAITSRTCSGFVEMEKQIVRQLSGLLGWDAKESAGVFTPGGKYCLTYAVKCGLNRVDFPTQERPVVITSEINHYSIESVCEHFGLGGRCIRVPVTHEGIIDFEIFRQILIKCFTKRIPIACIIFSGGNTTHCNVEKIKEGHDILYALLEKFNVNYIPYIYFDMVICWPWLFFKYYDFDKNKLDIPVAVLSKMAVILERIVFARLADGAGIDFHKGGFSPYTCSIFLSKKADELYAISDKTVKNNQHTPIEPNRYTLGNSRGTSDILSAWNILQSVGIEGFQAYVANMLIVANVLADALPTYGFTILEKNNTYGFATIIWAARPQKKLTFQKIKESSEETVVANNEYLYALSEYWITNKECSYYTRFLPNYTTISDNRKVAVISLLPMRLNIDEDKAREIAAKLGTLKKSFDQKYLSGMRFTTKEMPENVEK